MPYDITRTPDKFKSTPDSGNYLTGIYIGIVKTSADTAQKMGRFQVWIPEFGGNEDNAKNWYTVSYATPFGGSTDVTALEDGKSQQSYGWWAVPPDKGNEVAVFFANGDPARGYWFACIYQQNMNHMVPGIGVGPTPGGKKEPSYEYNRADPENKSKISDPDSIERPRFEPLADGLANQGLAEDDVKGTSTTSARRESPSRVFGYLTPRGNTIHIDDGELDEDGEPINEFIRLRTRSGVGLTINETTGSIFMISKNGNSYLEISDDGVNLYTENPMSLRTTSDYNIQSSGDVNIDAGGNLNIIASGYIAMGAIGDTHISAGGNLLMGSGGNSSIAAGGDLLMSAGGVVGIGAGGNLIMQGAKILEGIDPPAAPLPQAPLRKEFPDGPGGDGATGSSIGSRMPHRQGYDAEMEEVMSSGMADIPKSSRARAKKLYALLKKKGYSDVQIAALLGSFQQESSLDPTRWQHASKNINAPGGFGLAQWDDRKKALAKWAKANNRPWDTYETQIDFMEYEMRTSEKKAGQAFRSAKTLPEAMAAMKRYERYGIKGKREQYANSYLNILKTDGKV